MIRLLLFLLFALLTVKSFNTTVTTKRWHFARTNKQNETGSNLTESRRTIQPMEKRTTMARTMMDMDEEDEEDDDYEEEVAYDGMNMDDLPSNTEPEEMDPVGRTKFDEQLKQLFPPLDPSTKRANTLLCFKKPKRFRCYIGDGCLTNDEHVAHTKMVRLTKEYEFIPHVADCDVAVVIHVKSEQVERGHFLVEYHTTNKYFNLTIPVTEAERYNLAKVVDGELKCTGKCTVYHAKPFYKDSTSYYFNSDVHFFNSIPDNVDLAWCFKRLETRCFIGDGCLKEWTDDTQPEHKAITFINSEVKEKILSNYTLRGDAEGCSVGASFVPTDEKGKYSFSYHTNSRYTNLLINFNNREIAIDKNGTLTCSSKLADKGCKIEANDEIPYRSIFFIGEIYLFKNRTTITSEEAKANKSREHSSTMDSKSLPNVKNEEMMKEKESNIGKITLIAIASLFACIIIAIIGGVVYQRVTTSRNNRKRAEIEATIKPPVVEKVPPSAVQLPVVNSDPTSEISARGD